MTLYKKKRGAIQIQINWVFALIAGALILLVILGFLRRASAGKEIAIDAEVSLKIDTILAAAQSVRGTENMVNIPGDLTFDCNGYRYGKVQGGYGSNLIFAPSTISSPRMITYSQELSLPYRTANLLYLTSHRVRYIFKASPDNLSTELFDLMPKAAEAQLVETSVHPNTITDIRHERVRIIVNVGIHTNTGTFYSLLYNSIAARDPDSLDLITVFQGDSDRPIYQVGFYKLNITSSGFTLDKQFTVLGIEALLGAVYSEDAELFDCTINLVLNRYEAVTDVYHRRTIELENTNPSCTTEYKTAGTYLAKIGNALQNNPNPSDAIETWISALIFLNGNLKVASCPTIY